MLLTFLVQVWGSSHESLLYLYLKYMKYNFKRMRNARGHVDNCFIIIIIIVIICFIVAFRLRLCEWCFCQSVCLHLELQTQWKNYLKFVQVFFFLLNCVDLFQLCLKAEKRSMKTYTFFFWESFKCNWLVSNGAKILRTNRPEKKYMRMAWQANFFLNPTILATIKQKLILRRVVL